MVSDRLLEQFGSFLALANASADELAAILPSPEPLLTALAGALRIVIAGVRETAVRSWLDPSSRRLHDYLRLTLGHRREEVLLGFFGSEEGKLISQRTLAFGDGHSVSLSPASVLRTALSLRAPQILLVHNHPSGRAQPSKADYRSMTELGRRAAALDCKIIDHLIVGGTDVFSIRRRRIL